MPLINPSPWTGASDVGQGIAGSLGQIMLQMPHIRAQIQAQLAQQALNQQQIELERQKTMAQIPLYNAETEWNKARTANEGSMDRAKLGAANDLAVAGRENYLANKPSINVGGPTVENAQNSAMATLLGQLLRSSSLHGNVREGMDAAQGAQASTNAIGDPTTQMMLATKQHPFMDMTAGSTLMNLLTQKSVATAPGLLGAMTPKERLQNSIVRLLHGYFNPVLGRQGDEVDFMKQDLNKMGLGDVLEGAPTTSPITGSNIKAIRQIK